MPKPARQPAPPDPAADSAAPGDSALPMPEAMDGSVAEQSATGSGTSSDTRGKSTGLDTMLGRVFVERGYVTHDELEACREIQRRRTSDDMPVALADVLVENDYITRRQLGRLRAEVETEKTTQQIPGYKILKKLGAGAMATVFLARQLSLDRLVAIKVLPTKFSSNEKFIERFYKEGRAAAQLNHRNIVAAYDVGQAGEHHYFVMEYVDGESVYDRLKEKKRFAEKEAIEIVRQTAAALAHAHEKGFIHRDVKPKNIMITSSNVVKLADLGLARAVSDKEAAEAEAGRAYGTPYYISPEQIRGELKIDGRADIYGLGATFYHMVTGKVPFEGKNPSSVMHKHLKQTLTPPDHVNPRLSPETAMVIEMMMSKSRRKRYQSVDDLLVDLDKLARGEKPHFAQSAEDFTKLTEIEDRAQGQYVEAMPRESRPAYAAMSNPLFLGTLAVMVLSLLINLVLIAVLVSGNGADEGQSGSPRGTVAGSTSSSGGLVGAWASTGLSGNTFNNVLTVQLALYKNGDGSLVRWFEFTDPQATMFSWTASSDTITLRFSGGEARYGFELDGNTLRMERIGGSPASMTLVRQ